MACSVKIKSVVAIGTDAAPGAAIRSIRVSGSAANCDTVYLTSACFADPRHPRKAAPVTGGGFDVEIAALATAAGSTCRCGQKITVQAEAADPADPRNPCRDSWTAPLDCVACPTVRGLAATPASGGTPLLVALHTDVSNAGAIVPDAQGMLYHWDFGDGASDHTHTASVSHTYRSPGSYTASVAVNAARGCQPATATVAITAAGVAAARPVLLLPFRLETRFIDVAGGQSELWLRMYPAPIAIDGHRRDLTAAEITAGQAFWSATWNAMQSATADHEAGWRSLAGRYGARRAAWIAKTTRPANVDPATPLVFPSVAPSSATSVPHAAGLPDHWVVFTWDTPGATPQATTFPNPITQDLKVAPDPATTRSSDPADVALDPGSRWLVDFDAAVAEGMAIALPVSTAQRRDGFARIVVLGLRSAADGAAEFEKLLDAHHYSDGLAFVAQGTQSKNTADGSAGFTQSDGGDGTSYPTEQGPPLTDPPDPTDPAIEADGRIALRLLGFDPASGVFDHVEHADGLDQQDARDMAVALWPPTLGYFVRQMLGLRWPAQLAGIETVRAYFINNVRARGPIASIRVGDSPYGILPVTSLRPRPGARPRQPAWLFDHLFRIAPLWRDSAERNTPRVGHTNDPDRDLVGILGMEASSTSFQGRAVLGPWFTWNVLDWWDVDGFFKSLWMSMNRQLVAALWAGLGFGGALPNPPILDMTFEPDSSPIPGPIVQPEPLSETDALPAAGNYITRLLQAQTVADIRYQRFPGQPTALLYRLLRQALLLEYVHSAQDVLLARGLIDPDAVADPEFVDFPSAATDTPWDLLDRNIPGVGTPGQSLGAYIKDLEQSPTLLAQQFPRLAALRASFARLALRPTAKLERVLSETLDVCSHRLDAWVSSAATAWLTATRGREKVSGVYLGGFSWVENLVPAPPRPATRTLRTAEQQVVAAFDTTRRARVPQAPALAPVQPAAEDSGGFIHAPSAPQGVTAAILRSGYLTHRRTTNGESFAIDLSSDRVRTALWYLDGVRQGQSLGALLGYRVEERLLESHALERYIQPLRDRYPLVANQVTPAPDSTTPTDALAAPNVVDGLALQRDWAAGKLTWGDPLPDPGDPDQQVIITILEDVTDVLDAIGDVSFSESVYQIVRGNPVRAGGILAAISRGERPPEVQVVNTPHGGTSLTHRLAVFFPGDPPTPLAWNSGDTNPRAQAEPWLDAWLRTLLPDPATVKCWVEYDPGPPEPPQLPRVQVSLDDLDFGPLDLLAMSATADAAQLSELEQRVLYRVYQAGLLPPGATSPAVRFEGTLNRATEVSVPDLLVLARALRDLIAGARPLAASDVATPGTPVPGSAAADATEVHDRATAATTLAATAVQTLGTAVQQLGSAIASPGSADTAARAQAVRDALLVASWFGVRGSVPRGAEANGSPVTGVIVSLNAAATTYTIKFTTSANGALARQNKDAITLLAPPGTAFSSDPADYRVNGQVIQDLPRVTAGAVTVRVPTSIAAAANVTLIARNVTSPADGEYTLSVLTAADALATVSDPYAILTPGAGGTAVTPQSVTVSVPNPGVASRYEVRFTVSAAGALTGGVDSITLLGPPGTLFSASATDYNINRQVLRAPSGGSPDPIQVSGSAVTITVPNDIAAGSPVTLLASRVTNPGSSATTLAAVTTNPGLGTFTLGIATSADTLSACDGSGFALGPLPALIAQAMAAGAELNIRAQMPSAVTVQSVAIGASQYSIVFTTSAAGALSGAGGTIKIIAPPGTKFSSQASDYRVNGTQVKLPPRVEDASVRITVPGDIAASSSVTVMAQNVVIPAPAGGGRYTLSVLTSADVLAAPSPPYVSTGGGSAVTAVTATLSADGATFTVSFRTSAGGALSQQAGDAIVLHAPAGTGFSLKASDYTIAGQALSAAPKLDPGKVTLAIPADIAASTTVSVVARNVARPEPGRYTLGVATTADAAAVPSAAYAVELTATAWIERLQQLFGKGFVVLPRFAPPNGAELDGAFRDSTQLLGGATAARSAPARWLQQLTHVRPPMSRVDLAASLAQALAGSPPPGFAIAQLPRLPNDRWLALPLRSALSGVLVAMDDATAGAANVTYDVRLSTSGSGALPAGADRIILTAPPGTTLPTQGYSVSVSNGHAAAVGSVTTASWPAGGATNNQALVTLATSSIAAGDRLTVTIAGVTNPAAPGEYALVAATSADPEPMPSATYTIASGAAGTAGPSAAPATARISLVALTTPGFDPTQTTLGGGGLLTGLLLDEWPEQIPNRVESTSLVFHHEEPTARAPQALLLAVSPSREGTWTDNNFELLRTILEETLDLVKIRTADLAGITMGGQILPALYLATNTEGDTVANNWAVIDLSGIVNAATAEFEPGVQTAAGTGAARTRAGGGG